MPGTHLLQWADVKPARSVDIIVVGSGAAGSTAALSAKWAGAKDVLLLEKDGKTAGGTTAKSGGTFWIPNNPVLKKMKRVDSKEHTLNFMARLSYPEKYTKDSSTLGLDQLEYDWLAQYYDKGSDIIAEMEAKKVIKIIPAKFNNGELAADYNHEPSMPVRDGKLLGSGMPSPGIVVPALRVTNALFRRILPPIRTLMPAVKEALFLEEFALDISYGIGITFVKKLQASMKSAGVAVEMGSSVDAVVVRDGRVCGVRVVTSKGSQVIEARNGVIFGSGGFAHSKDLRQKYLKDKPIDGTAAAGGNDGVATRVSEELGCDLVHMDRIWGAQCIVEESQQTFETEGSIFVCRGDSAILVNLDGKRVCNEKTKYDNRVRVHWDEAKRNRFLFLLADKRCVDLYGMNFAKSLPASPSSPFYIKGSSVEAFSKAARTRIAAVASKAGEEGLTLSADFESNLKAQIERFNSYAKAGKDEEFHRGETPYEIQWHYVHAKGSPNPTMHPIDTSNLYGVIIGPQATETKGGPRIDLDARCLKDGNAIPGFYACGNASGAISADAYWSGGVPIGSAIITGYLAGKHAAGGAQIQSRL